MNINETFLGPPLTPVQGQDSIVINAPHAVIWEAIARSKLMEEWGPPVDRVELLTPNEKEGLGARRRVFATMGAHWELR